MKGLLPYVESDVGEFLLIGKGDETQVVGVVVEVEVEVVEAVEVVGVAGVEKVVGGESIVYQGEHVVEIGIEGEVVKE